MNRPKCSRLHLLSDISIPGYLLCDVPPFLRPYCIGHHSFVLYDAQPSIATINPTHHTHTVIRRCAAVGTPAHQSVLFGLNEKLGDTSRLDFIYSTLLSESDLATRGRLLAPVELCEMI